MDSEERAFLAGYDPRAFPPFAVTVDVVLLTVHDGAFSVLLVERDTHPFRGGLALPGGFVQPEEDLDAAAVRRLEDETGVRRSAAHMEQLGAFGAPGRDPRMRVVSVAYLVFAPNLPAPRPGRRTRSVAWVAVSLLPGSSGPGRSSSTPPWPPRSAGPSSRSGTCGMSTRRSGGWRSTRATSTGR